MRYKALAQPEKWIFKRIPCLFIIGTPIHFLYDIFGKNPVVGFFAPVNESLWEHAKIATISRRHDRRLLYRVTV